jgi:hypothetical protein
MSSAYPLFEALSKFSFEFNRLKSLKKEEEQKESISQYSQIIQDIIASGESPDSPGFLGLIPLAALVNLNCFHAFTHFLNLLHPGDHNPSVDHYDRASFSATPVIFLLLQKQKFLFALELVKKGARLDFIHPALDSTPLHFLCQKLIEDSTFYEENLLAQAILIEIATRDHSLPWDLRGKIAIGRSINSRLEKIDPLMFIPTPFEMLSYYLKIPQARPFRNKLLTDSLKKIFKNFAKLTQIIPHKETSEADLLLLKEQKICRFVTQNVHKKLAQEYLKYFFTGEEYSKKNTTENFLPEDILISLILDGIIFHQCHLDADGNTISHLACMNGDRSLIKKLTLLGLITPISNRSDKSIFDLDLLEHLPKDQFTATLCSSHELPPEALSLKIPSPLTQLLYAWAYFEHQKSELNLSALHEFLDFFIYADTKNHAHQLGQTETHFLRLRDSLGRTPLQIGAEIKGLNLDLFSKLITHQQCMLPSTENTWPSPLRIAIQASSSEKITILVDEMGENFFRVLPITGGSPLLEICKKTSEELTEVLNPRNTHNLGALTSSIFIPFALIARSKESLDMGNSYAFINAEGKLTVQSTFIILNEVHSLMERFLKKHMKDIKTIFEDNPYYLRLIDSIARDITLNKVFLLLQKESELRITILRFEEALEVFHIPSLYHYLIRLPCSLELLKDFKDTATQKFKLVQDHLASKGIEYSGYRPKTIDTKDLIQKFIDQVQKKINTIEKEKTHEEAFISLLEDEDAEREREKEKEKLRLTSQKAKQSKKPKKPKQPKKSPELTEPIKSKKSKKSTEPKKLETQTQIKSKSDPADHKKTKKVELASAERVGVGVGAEVRVREEEGPAGAGTGAKTPPQQDFPLGPKGPFGSIDPIDPVHPVHPVDPVDSESRRTPDSDVSTDISLSLSPCTGSSPKSPTEKASESMSTSPASLRKFSDKKSPKKESLPTAERETPEFFKPYEPHYQTLVKSLSLCFVPAELAQRLWIYGSILDPFTSSPHGDIDFVLHLSENPTPARLEKITKQLTKSYAAPLGSNVVFNAKHRLWTIQKTSELDPEKMEMEIDLRLLINPRKTKEALKAETDSELIIHKAQRLNPDSFEVIKTGEKQNFALSRKFYDPKSLKSIPDFKTIAYLIKNMAVTTRKFDKSFNGTLMLMTQYSSLDQSEKHPELYAAHFIAFNFAFEKYQKHIKALLKLCEKLHFIALLLGIDSVKARIEHSKTEAEPLIEFPDSVANASNPFFAACAAHHEFYTRENIEKMARISTLQQPRNKILIEALPLPTTESV